MVDPAIVVGVDGSGPALDAVRWAAREATVRRAPLLLLSCITYRGTEDGPRLAETLHARAERNVAEARETARAGSADADLDIRAEVSHQNAPGSLVDRSAGAEMVVLGRRGLGEFTDGLIGSVTSAVVRHAQCPVAVIDGWSRVADGTGPVVVGIDGSPSSARAVGMAFEECSLHNAELIALHAWSDQDLSILPVGVEQTAERSVLDAAVAEWCERFPDVSVRRTLVRDRPVRHLLELADEAQLIVVGSRGRGGFPGMTLGSTSAALVHITPCPLLIAGPIRPGR
ncbi:MULTISPECIES: universal stress protein [unclassified Rhodococcus (in: high G+C Gram-positive bacteria)]|uniref:universal stress protein n=1 Tax=unclassified Rhodococcus (in: high G+C Gram-positive bacteria) TaxID=192944 RepID=UPI00031DA655|nr:universal stress protein [Rhodococcus sp. DK17]